MARGILDCPVKPGNDSGFQFPVTLAARMIGVHRGDLAFHQRGEGPRAAVGIVGDLAAEIEQGRLRVPGSSSALSSAPSNFSRIGPGVALGANSPLHADAWNSGRPASAAVGTFGSAGLRVFVPTAKALMAPASRVCDRQRHVGAHVVDLAADQGRHRRGAAVERHHRRLHAEDRVEQQAGGEERRADAGVADVELAVSALTRATNSRRSFAGKSLRATMIAGMALAKPIGSKSTSGL